MKFKVGDRVSYKENGVDDQGVITEIHKPEPLPELYAVKWDDGESDLHEVDQLAAVKA